MLCLESKIPVCQNVTGLKSFTLTHILYPPTFLGLIMALFSLCPQAALVWYLALALQKHKKAGILLFAGIMDQALNSVLKNIIKQPRPQDLTYGYGMPSAHAQFAGLFAMSWKHGWILSIGVCVSRVYLQYHTVEQVLVGALIGVLWGLFIRLRVLGPLQIL